MEWPHIGQEMIWLTVWAWTGEQWHWVWWAIAATCVIFIIIIIYILLFAFILDIKMLLSIDRVAWRTSFYLCFSHIILYSFYLGYLKLYVNEVATSLATEYTLAVWVIMSLLVEPIDVVQLVMSFNWCPRETDNSTKITYIEMLGLVMVLLFEVMLYILFSDQIVHYIENMQSHYLKYDCFFSIYKDTY